jgi:hypothetical protein
MSGTPPSVNRDRLADVDRLLLEQAPSPAMDSTGRARARVEARIRAGLHAGPARPRLSSLGILAAAGVIGVAAIVWTTWPVPTPSPPFATSPSLPPAVARLLERLDQSAGALRAVRPEDPMLTEARRLRAEVERGVEFFRSVMPRMRVHG